MQFSLSVSAFTRIEDNVDGHEARPNGLEFRFHSMRQASKAWQRRGGLISDDADQYGPCGRQCSGIARPASLA